MRSERPWLDRYPPGVPATFVPRRHHMLDHWDEAIGATPAIVYHAATIRFDEIDRAATGLAGWWHSAGVRPGDRVALVLQNVPEFTIAAVAAWKLGAIPVPCNPMYREAELAALFGDFAPSAIVCDAAQRPEIEAAVARAGLAPVLIATADPADPSVRPDPRTVVRHADHAGADLYDRCRIGAATPLPVVPRQGGDLALILYTSGTTGKPKGAMIRHTSLCFNAELSALWMGVDASSRVLALAPFFHITGFVLHMAVAIVARCPVGMTHRFHPEATLDFQRRFRATTTIAAVTAFNALACAPGAKAEDFASFVRVFSGGAPISPALREDIRQRLGIELTPVYGMTETCSPTHMAPRGSEVPVDAETGALSAGVPISSTEMRIVDADGLAVPPGTPGEVWLRGPQVMAGYWRRPDETAATLTPDGWIRSGDVGIMDAAGWLFIVDRQKDMINASGFKVWPRQVEDALLEHPAVREAAVVGEPDPYRGETVAAHVAFRAGAEADPAELEAHCRDRLAAYKVPRRFVVVDELPKTATGKIRRAALREVAGIVRD